MKNEKSIRKENLKTTKITSLVFYLCISKNSCYRSYPQKYLSISCRLSYILIDLPLILTLSIVTLSTLFIGAANYLLWT